MSDGVRALIGEPDYEKAAKAHQKLWWEDAREDDDYEEYSEASWDDLEESERAVWVEWAVVAVDAALSGFTVLELTEVANVVKAITAEGPQPRFHREIMERHRREWPTLWRALDALVSDWEEV